MVQDHALHVVGDMPDGSLVRLTCNPDETPETLAAKVSEATAARRSKLN